MNALVKHAITFIFALIGLTVIGANAVKIYRGCSDDQVLIKSVVTYECVRR